VSLVIRRILTLSLFAVAGFAGCFPEGTPPPYARGAGSSDAGGGTGGTPADAEAQPGACVFPVHSAEPLPPREAVMRGDVQPGDQEVFVSVLFSEFYSACGGCHTDGTSGDFHTTLADFTVQVDEKVLDAIRNPDSEKVMPPLDAGGMPWEERGEGDPIKVLAERLELWIRAGRPADVFYVPRTGGVEPSYVFSRELAENLTNIGSCVPEKNFPFARITDEMDALDEKFARLEPAPPGQGTLAERLGLPETLAETDLTTFDSAELARRGVIAFAPGYPLWSDAAGKLRHVRVPRGQSIRFNKERQEFEIPPNTRFYKTFFKKVTDLNGEERYRKIETRLIVARPDRLNGQGSREPTALFGAYQWDETETTATLVTLAQRNGEPFKDVVFPYATNEPLAKEIRDRMPQNLTYELEFAGVLRHYGIPSKQRCIQCHMGSPSSSFVLGFTPMQIRRRPAGEGGVIEPSGADELSQFQRLIDLGVITGIESPEEVVLLEDSQGDRKPRNYQELEAQGYMFGNCAHCHNPNGFPSVVAPELGERLDFWPRPEGGIFQFPLELTSPRIGRGIESTPIPYITPSLVDLASDSGAWTQKHATASEGLQTYNLIFHAPWRSLIYRNVSTPFTYSDDLAIFPHMPMNTPGFDCRAPRILGDWMVSIPAIRKLDGVLAEYLVPDNSRVLRQDTDLEPQPYFEVKPGEPRYEEAKILAEERLETYHNGGPYNYCPDTSDIVDPDVLHGTGGITTPQDTVGYYTFLDGVPDHPHWVDTDLTERLGPWAPRRPDWADVLIDGKFPEIPARAPNRGALIERQNREKIVVAELGHLAITAGARSLSSSEVPLGIWKKKPGCNFDGVPKVGDFQPGTKPLWMRDIGTDEPIFQVRPGQAIYDMICVNCHGRNHDSLGRQAATVQELSGGNTRVANFMWGLFGPPDMPGDNRVSEFGKSASGPLNADDLAVRYLIWMALGGTQRVIPQPVLAVVARTDVAGIQRGVPLTGTVVDANMLSAAVAACEWTLPYSPMRLAYDFRVDELLNGTALIQTNGDSELWRRVCSLDNPAPVRGIKVEGFKPVAGGREHLYDPASFPAGAEVMDHNNEIRDGLTADNLFPWCVEPVESERQAAVDSFRERYAKNERLPPYCPAGLQLVDRDVWSRRGAMNAGVMVFLYLDAVSRGQLTPLRYDECDRL
jgi:mono/diheme cytochrome c family protein